MSSSSDVPKIGTRIEPYSARAGSERSAASETMTRRSTGIWLTLRYTTYSAIPAAIQTIPT